MLIYLNKKSANLIEEVLHYHQAKTISKENKLIYDDLLSQIREGKLNY